MSEARQVTDRLTEAVINEDLDAVPSCYAPDAVVIAPEGTYKGRDQIVDFFTAWFEPFSELTVTVTTKAAWGNQALDEWSLSATNTGALAMPTGETVAATGKRVTVRGADICTVENGIIAEHHMYYDQLELLGQLGLVSD